MKIDKFSIDRKFQNLEIMHLRFFKHFQSGISTQSKTTTQMFDRQEIKLDQRGQKVFLEAFWTFIRMQNYNVCFLLRPEVIIRIKK